MQEQEEEEHDECVVAAEEDLVLSKAHSVGSSGVDEQQGRAHDGPSEVGGVVPPPQSEEAEHAH